MCTPLQVPPTPDHGQDPRRNDVAYQGVVDYHPQPPAVSIFHLQ